MILTYPLNIGFLSTTTLSGLKSVPMVGPAYEASISFSLLSVNRLQGREPVNKCQQNVSYCHCETCSCHQYDICGCHNCMVKPKTVIDVSFCKLSSKQSLCQHADSDVKASQRYCIVECVVFMSTIITSCQTLSIDEL